MAKSAGEAAAKMVTFNIKLYSAMFERCPKGQLNQLRSLEAKHKNYVDEINAKPDKPPRIDWEFYRRVLSCEQHEMIDDFEKKYCEFVVPRPKENVTEQKELQKFKDDSDCKIEDFNEQIKNLELVLPFDEMTAEEYADMYPDQAPDFICKPTFWPHDIAENTPKDAHGKPIKEVKAKKKEDKSGKKDDKKSKPKSKSK